jgi:hypothetical protein
MSTVGVACGFPEVHFDASDAGDGGNGIAPITRGDAGRVDEGGCGTDPCDCDGDTYRNSGCGGAPPDCDDFDPLIHPDPDGGFVAEPWPAESPWKPAGDWNCDGKVEKDLPENLTCSIDCKGIGFEGEAACGVVAVYKECSGAAGLCTKNTLREQPQRCR